MLRLCGTVLLRWSCVLVVLGACGRSASPARPVAAASPDRTAVAAPSRADAEVVVTADALVSRDADPPFVAGALFPGVPVTVVPPPGAARRRELVTLTERAHAFVDEAGVRYLLLEVRCEDLVPRGGSDCWDLGYMNPTALLRAAELPAGRPRWERRLDRRATACTSLGVGSGVLSLSFPEGALRFATRDGAPVP